MLLNQNFSFDDKRPFLLKRISLATSKHTENVFAGSCFFSGSGKRDFSVIRSVNFLVKF